MFRAKAESGLCQSPLLGNTDASGQLLHKDERRPVSRVRCLARETPLIPRLPFNTMEAEPRPVVPSISDYYPKHHPRCRSYGVSPVSSR